MSEITFEFACMDDCLDKMVPSDLRQLVAERDRLRAQLAEGDGMSPEQLEQYFSDWLGRYLTGFTDTFDCEDLRVAYVAGYELAAEIIDTVLKNAAMHKIPYEDGKSPTYCLGLELGETMQDIAEMLAEHRLGA